MKNFKRSAFSKALVYAAITGLVSFGGYAYAEEINAYDNLTSPAAVRKYVNTHRYKKINKPNLVFNKSSLKTTASKGGEITGFAAMQRHSEALAEESQNFAKGGSITGFAAPNTPTLDEMATKASSFTPSQQYELKTAKGSNTHFLILNGKQYWYTPNEGSADKNNILTYLAGCALTTTGASESNYVFKQGTNYYTFDKTNLPTSGYKWNETGKLVNLTDDGTRSNYDFAVSSPDGEGSGGVINSTKYYNINTDLKKASSAGSKLSDINWSTTEPTDYTWADDYVAGSNVTVDTTAGTVKGAIRLKTPHNGTVPVSGSWNKWFTYTYTKPTEDYTITQDRINDTIATNGSNVQNKVFAGISGASNGGAIYNTQNRSTVDIIADFVGNSSSSYGGAISNFSYVTASIGSIVGDFVGNSSSSGYSSYGGAIYNSNGTIGSITGDFIGNSASSYSISYFSGNSSYGGAIYNERTIGSIVGDFIGNSASSGNSSSGGAISNRTQNGTVSIGSIVGDFIGNSASSSYSSYSSDSYSYGGAIFNYAQNDTSSATIGSIVGDFIGNSASSSSRSSSSSSSYGGAISNYAGNGTASIGSIVGDFIGNYAKTTSSSGKAYGGAIFNGKSSTSYSAGAQITLAGNTFTGNYVDNNGTQTPNSIFNAGVINIAADKTVTINDGYDGLSQAQLNIGTGSTFNLSVDNDTIQTDNLGTVTNNGSINWDLDVDFSATQKSDLITVNDSSSLGSGVLIRSINLKTDPTSEYTVDVATADSVLANALRIAGGTLLVRGVSNYWNVTYDSGVLTFEEGSFISGGGTIDDINLASREYLALAKDAHTQYDSDDLVTTKDDAHPDIVVINGTIYYFKAAESTDKLTQDVRNLAATGSRAIKEVESTDNWIFSVGGKFYSYNKKQLPKSAYTISAGSDTDYNWKTTDGTTTSYYKLNFPGDSKRATNFVTLSDTEPLSAQGSINVKLPNNEIRTVYYSYDTTKETSGRINDNIAADGTNVKNKVFAGIPSSSNGGAIYNNQDRSTVDIISDFIGNSSDLSGGAVYNTGTLASLQGDFVGNTSQVSSGSFSFPGGGGVYNEGTISTLIGNFIANSTSAYGGAVLNKGMIEALRGDFIGNSANNGGGAIYNFGGTIGSITGDFIGNARVAIYNRGGTIGSITGDFIGNAIGAIGNGGTITSITGNFIGNSDYSGGAIGNGGTITSITGNFIGNSASFSDYSYGGAISNDTDSGTARIGSLVGDFIGNYAKITSSSGKAYGGAIFNGYLSSGTPQYRANAQITLAGNTFTGNYVDKNGTQMPNSIYNAGIINIAADKTVTINDGYDGLSEAQLNIGTGSTFNLSVDNDTIQTDNLGTVTNNGSINWDLDVDFGATQKSDLITVNNSSTLGSGVLIRSINLKTDPTDTTGYEINVATSGSALINALYIAGDGKLVVQGVDDWNVTYESSSGNLVFAIINTLAKQVHATTPLERTFDMTTADELVRRNLGLLQGDTGVKLDIDGGGFKIIGGTYEGITVDENQTLTFNNVSDVTGFANDTAVTNGGNLEISGSTFTSKIANNASMTLNGKNTLNGAVSGANGETVISTGTTTVGAYFTQKDLTVESGAGLTIAADNLNITNKVKNDGTVTLKGGELSSSIANKTESVTTAKTVIDGDVSVAYGTTIEQAIEVNGSKSLTANVASIKGDVNNGGNLYIFSQDAITSDTTHFTQDVTGNGTTTIQRNVNVDGSIANNIVIDKYVDSTVDPAVTYYANVVVGSGEDTKLGAAGKTITITEGHNGDTYNTLTANAGKIAADTVANDGRLVLTGGEAGFDITKGTESGGGIVDITAGTDGTVATSHNITNQTVNVNTGTLHLTTTATDGSNLSGSTVNVTNSAILNTIDDVINDYSSTVLLADGAIVKADIDSTTIDKYGAAQGTTSVTLGDIKIKTYGDFQSREFQLVDGNVTVTANNIEIISSGKSISVVGSGQANGRVLVSESTSSDKLNGAVYISPTKAYITYKMTEPETVNADRPALGYIKDNFTINSDVEGTQRTITATANTKGLIVDSGKSLTLQDVKFENFATGEVNSTTYPVYNGDYKGIITNYGTLNVKDSYFAVSDGDGNTKKIAIANYGTLTSDPTTYEGAIANYRGANATITGDTFSGIDRSSITDANGGAIYNEAAAGSSPAGILTLNKVTATGNKAVNGGALYNAGTATINGGTYSGNSATALGGAIYSSTDLTVNANAERGAVSFSNNKHQTATTEALNDIYMAGATGTPIALNLNAADTTNTITLGSGVAGTNYNVNVNDGATGLVSIAGVKDAVTIALKGGELDLTADSNATTLNASDATTLNASSTNGLTVDTLTVENGKTFTNEGVLNVNTTLNNGTAGTGTTGTITNTNGTLNLFGGTGATAPMTNVGTISGGNINIGSYISDTEKDIAYVVNSGSISGEISVAKESTLQTAANTVNDSTGIANAGKLTLTGGNLASAVSGAGVTNITGEVTNTANKTIANAVEITNTGKLTTATNTLTSSTTTKNAGTLVFNNTADGALGQSIADNAGTHGTVEINVTDGKTIDMNGKTITNNIIKLTSGTLKTGSTDGNIDLSGVDKIEANGGTLSVQDGKTGTIKLGNVDTSASDLKVAIDADFTEGSTRDTDGVYIGSADKLSLASGKAVTGTNKIKISDIKIADTPDHSTDPYATEFKAQIADDSVKNSVDLSSTTLKLSGITDDAGDLLISYNDGWINGKHTDLKNAITSSIEQKMFLMADGNLSSETADLQLGGTSLSVTTNGNNITGNDSISIKLASDDQILSIIGTNSDTTQPNTTISGFDTAIDNTAGGRVNLTDVTMTGNTKDIINNGEIDTTTTPATENGVYLAGTNNINSIVDSDGTHTHGQTTVEAGTSTIGTIQQKSVTVAAGATANLTNVDNVATGDGITNDGDLVLAGGTATTAATNNNVIKKSDSTTGNAKTTIAAGSNITNAQTMTQKEVVLSAATTTPAADAAKLANNSTINADTISVKEDAKLENNNGAKIFATNGTDKASIVAEAGAEIGLNKGSEATADVTLNATDTSKSMLAITDNGKLKGNVISDNGATIELIADDEDITMSSAITGAITGSTAGDKGVYAIVAHSVPDTSTTPATVHSVTIDKAIAGATSINIENNTDAVVTNVATASNTTAPINVGSDGNLTLRNDSATDNMTVANAIQKASATSTGYDVNTANTNADRTITVTGNITGANNVNTNTVGGTTALAGNVSAVDVTNKSGTLDIASGSSVNATNAITNESGVTNIDTLVYTPTISSKGTGADDTVNINGDGDTSTSAKIGSANIDIADDASVTVNTDSSAYTLNNDVAGETADSAIVLNGNAGTPNSPTDVGTQFNIASTINGGTVELANGQLNLPNESVLTNADGLRIDSGATLNAINNATTNYNKPTEFKDDAQLKIDANVFTKLTDKFTNATEGSGEKLTDISVQGLDKIYNTTSVNLTSNTGLSKLQAGDGLADLISGRYDKIVTPVRILRGQVTQSGNDLLLQFVPKGDGYKSFNSAVLAAPIAAQMGGYLNQLHSYDEAFRNMDMYMLMTKEQRQAMKMKNHYATTSKDLIYDATTNQYENKAGWFRPYATFENVGLDNGPNVSNVAYGSYAGAESEMYDLGHGWDGMWGVYVGYNGSHQTYGYGNSIYQNGGTLGLVGMAYKNNFFTGLTINAGANGAEAQTMYGSENFAMLMAGIASKTGYNWELANGKFIIQPNATISYSFVNTFDYRNAAGINISSDPLHAIQIEPGIKFIGNLKNGWQPYASVSMVWNIMDKTHFHANEVALPDMSVKPFVKYGVGVRKSWGERFTAFFQTYFTNGGRNGVGLQAGFRWTLGKGSSKSGKAKTSNTKEIKKTVIKSQNVASK